LKENIHTHTEKKRDTEDGEKETNLLYLILKQLTHSSKERDAQRCTQEAFITEREKKEERVCVKEKRRNSCRSRIVRRAFSNKLLTIINCCSVLLSSWCYCCSACLNIIVVVIIIIIIVVVVLVIVIVIVVFVMVVD